MVPDYRHADPPPIPDGHTVPNPTPPPEPAPPITTAERWWALAFLLALLAALTIGALR